LEIRGSYLLYWKYGEATSCIGNTGKLPPVFEIRGSYLLYLKYGEATSCIGNFSNSSKAKQKKVFNSMLSYFSK